MRRLAAFLFLFVLPFPAVRGEDLVPEAVAIRTDDGLVIAGDLWPSGRKGSPGVVALHMYASDRSAFAPVAERFARAGFDFLAIDMRGHGESAKQDGVDLSEKVRERDPVLFNAMYRDAGAAVAFLRSRGTDRARIGLLGASVGCSVAIDAARRDSDILGLALMTPGESYLGVPTMEHMKGMIWRPMLILSSEEEAAAGATGIARVAGEQAELHLFKEKGVHGTAMFGAVPGVAERIVDWFTNLLGAPIAFDGKGAAVEQAGRWLSAVTTEEQLFIGVLPKGAPELGRAWKATEDGVTEMIRRDGKWVAVRLKRAPGIVPPRVVLGDALELLVHLDAETVRAGYDVVGNP